MYDKPTLGIGHRVVITNPNSCFFQQRGEIIKQKRIPERPTQYVVLFDKGSLYHNPKGIPFSRTELALASPQPKSRRKKTRIAKLKQWVHIAFKLQFKGPMLIKNYPLYHP